MINYLYKFEIGSEVFTLTSAEYAIDLEGVSYEAAVISHDNLKFQTALVKSQLSVNIQTNHALALLLKQGTGYESTKFTLYKIQDGNSQVFWKGSIIGRSFSSATTLKLKIGSVLSGFGKGESRRFSSRSCNHVLYSAQCGATKTATSGTLIAINNYAPLCLISVLKANTVDSFLSGSTIIDGASRYITNCTNGGTDGTNPLNDLYIVYLDKPLPFDTFSTGLAVSLYKGCDKSIEICNSRFSNKDNFGGQPQLPLNNPFATTQYL